MRSNPIGYPHKISLFREGKRELNKDQDDSDSELQQIKRQEQDLDQSIEKAQKHIKNNKKMVVGTNFSFDITEYFNFQQRVKLQSTTTNIFDQISGGHLSWFILFYSIINASIIPVWNNNIKASKYLKVSWRFLMQSLMITPFVMYQMRSTQVSTRQKYKLSNVLKLSNLKKVYLSALCKTFWFVIILTCFQWTYISHVIILGNLSNFFLSLSRTLHSRNHELQPGGQVLVFIGILLIIQDSYQCKVPSAPQEFLNSLYASRECFQRILADFTALGVAFCMSNFDKFTNDIRNYYPPYLSMLLINSLLSINMALAGYFLNGASFSLHSLEGVFGLFTYSHFGSFLYMGIVLCMGMFISFSLISKLFSDPIIPALAMTLQPIFTTLFLQISGVQQMPGSYAFIGYLLIVPGLFLILIGQCLFQRQQKDNNEAQNKTLQKLKQARQKVRESINVRSNPGSPTRKRLIQNEQQQLIH